MKSGPNLTGIIKFVQRDEWRPHFDQVMDDHLGPPLDEFEIEYEELGALIGEQWANTLWGCAFEDFLTRSLDPDGVNPVETYLKRRGWNEAVSTKAYLRALRASAMSLYEVSNIVPGKSMLARDLIRGGDPILVSERSATRTLKAWARIGARIVSEGKTHVLGGGLLAFSFDAANTLLEGLRQILPKRRRGALPLLADDELSEIAPLFTQAWLLDVLPKALGLRQPRIQNTDGDELVFHMVRYPLAPGVTQKDIAASLDTIDAFEPENARFWNWLGGPQAERTARDEDGSTLATTMSDGSTVLGNIELKGRFLILSVNSASRAERGMALIGDAVGGMVRTPLTEIQTVDQMRASRSSLREAEPDIPPEMAAEIVHAMLDRQYRKTLDEPVPMLGDVTPRAAARSAKGREKLVEWLKYLENQSARDERQDDPMAGYDIAWMWRELGIEDLRR